MSNHHHATTQRPVDVSARTLDPFDEFDALFLADAPVVDKDAGIDWREYPDPVDLDEADDNPEAA